MPIDQIAIDVALATEMIHDQFPQFRGEQIVALETAGTTNAIFRIGSQHAARLPLRRMDPEDCANALAAEMRASAEFYFSCPLPSPRPIGMGRPASGYPLPWIVQTWVRGEPATPTAMRDSSTFALELARLLTRLRDTDLKGRAFDGKGRGGNLRDHDDWIEVCLRRSERILDVKHLRAMWHVLRDLPPPDRDVMSHRDLIPANLLVTGECLTGVLDTGGFGPADPALDLVAGWHLLDREARAVFRQSLHTADLEWRRGAAWAFQQAMGLVWYYRDTNPAMAALGRTTIARLIEDADDLM